MRSLFGDVLPDAVLERSTKAFFDGAFWNAPSRAFVSEWDGSGVDLDVVDPDALRLEWSSRSPRSAIVHACPGNLACDGSAIS